MTPLRLSVNKMSFFLLLLLAVSSVSISTGVDHEIVTKCYLDIVCKTVSINRDIKLEKTIFNALPLEGPSSSSPPPPSSSSSSSVLDPLRNPLNETALLRHENVESYGPPLLPFVHRMLNCSSSLPESMEVLSLSLSLMSTSRIGSSAVSSLHRESLERSYRANRNKVLMSPHPVDNPYSPYGTYQTIGPPRAPSVSDIMTSAVPHVTSDSVHRLLLSTVIYSICKTKQQSLETYMPWLLRRMQWERIMGENTVSELLGMCGEIDRFYHDRGESGERWIRKRIQERENKKQVDPT